MIFSFVYFQLVLILDEGQLSGMVFVRKKRELYSLVFQNLATLFRVFGLSCTSQKKSFNRYFKQQQEDPFQSTSPESGVHHSASLLSFFEIRFRRIVWDNHPRFKIVVEISTSQLFLALSGFAVCFGSGK